MLTAKDIKKLSDYLLVVFKDVFVTKDEIKIVYKKIDHLQTTVGKIVKDHKNLNEKVLIHEYRITKLENAK